MPLPIIPAHKEAVARAALRTSPSEVCQFFVIYLPTGETVGVTNASQPIYDSALELWFRADLGLGPSAISHQISPGQSDGSAAQLFFASETISQALVESGLLDGARFEHFMAPKSLEWKMPKSAGFLASITQGGERGTGGVGMQFVGLENVLSGDLLETTGPMCRYELGDERCGVDVDEEDKNGRPIRLANVTVTSVGDGTSVARDPRRAFRSSALDSHPAGHWNGARIRFNDGDNAPWGWFLVERSGMGTSVGAGLTGSDGHGWLELSLPLPFPVTAGEKFEIWAGCNKILDSDCRDRYDNVINFGGERDIPTEAIYEKEDDD